MQIGSFTGFLLSFCFFIFWFWLPIQTDPAAVSMNIFIYFSIENWLLPFGWSKSRCNPLKTWRKRARPSPWLSTLQIAEAYKALMTPWNYFCNGITVLETKTTKMFNGQIIQTLFLRVSFHKTLKCLMSTSQFGTIHWITWKLDFDGQYVAKFILHYLIHWVQEH